MPADDCHPGDDRGIPDEPPLRFFIETGKVIEHVINLGIARHQRTCPACGVLPQLADMERRLKALEAAAKAGAVIPDPTDLERQARATVRAIERRIQWHEATMHEPALGSVAWRELRAN